jgi:hypothetical protein
MLAALHQPLPGGLHRLAAVVPAEIVDLALGTAGLAERPHPGDARVTVTAGDFRAARERASAKGAGAAVAALRGGGAPARQGELLAAALVSVSGAASVTVLQGYGSTRVEGATTGWLDAGARGLWQVEGANVGAGSDASAVGTAEWYQAPVAVAAVSAGDLRAQVVAAWSAACGRGVGLGRSTRV